MKIKKKLEGVQSTNLKMALPIINLALAVKTRQVPVLVKFELNVKQTDQTCR